MTNVDEEIKKIRLKTLEAMKKRRDALNRDIAELEYAIEHPTPPLNIDFEAIEEEARKDMEFLEKCKKIREGAWIDS